MYMNDYKYLLKIVIINLIIIINSNWQQICMLELSHNVCFIGPRKKTKEIA